mmetsp:Transcript_6249/g.26466  ORF Transcript_6249/g.26466 Transcript_6249/m.26466 type:complete len:128 (-) Transcript_6249:2649-3032(-)
MSFGAVAAEMSSCPSKNNGGELGWIAPGKTDKDFERAAFNTDAVGKCQIIQSKHGFHVMEVETIKYADVDSVRSSSLKTKVKQYECVSRRPPQPLKQKKLAVQTGGFELKYLRLECLDFSCNTNSNA